MKINNRVGSVHITLDTKRIDGNIREAQRLLTNQVWADCTPLIPFRQGGLRNNVSMGINADYIEWNSPYAHYQYMGELYLAGNGSSWAHKGEKKHPAGKPLSHIEHPETGAKWFEVAKEQNLKSWVDLVKKTVGKE